MYYVKMELTEGVTIQADITEENVFNRCPQCGAEVPVNLDEVVTGDGLDLYGSALCCDKCSKAIKDKQEAKVDCRGTEYFNSFTAAMKAAIKVWEADGVSPKERVLRLQAAFPEIFPKLPPEAFPDDDQP